MGQRETGISPHHSEWHNLKLLNYFCNLPFVFRLWMAMKFMEKRDYHSHAFDPAGANFCAAHRVFTWVQLYFPLLETIPLHIKVTECVHLSLPGLWASGRCFLTLVCVASGWQCAQSRYRQLNKHRDSFQHCSPCASQESSTALNAGYLVSNGWAF
jgi:hypothetical protein